MQWYVMLTVVKCPSLWATLLIHVMLFMVFHSRKLKVTESFATSFGMQSTLLKCNSEMVSNQMKKCKSTETNRQLINGFYPDWQTVLNFVIKDSRNMTSLVLQRLFTISGFMNCVMFTLKLSNLSCMVKLVMNQTKKLLKKLFTRVW